MAFFAELLGWVFLGVVKFLLVPFLMVGAGKPFIEVILVASSGAAIGVYGISFFSRRLFRFLSERGRKRGARKITLQRRRVVKVKSRFGLLGLIAMSALISVPVTTLLATKYFRTVPWMRLKLTLGFSVWSIILTLIALGIRKLVMND